MVDISRMAHTSPEDAAKVLSWSSDKFNRRCTWEHCSNWRRTNHIFCPADYKALPRHLQLRLWSDDPKKLKTAIEEAIQYLNDKRDNALIVHEEGP